MPGAPPYRVLPNPLQGVAGCATVVTVFRQPWPYRPRIGVRHAVPSLRGPPRRPAARSRLGRRVDIAGEAAQGRRGRGTAGRAVRRHGPAGTVAARPVRPRTAPTQ